jgi:hypothetical protein
VHSFFRRRNLELPNPPYHPALYDPENHEFGEVTWNSFPLHRPLHRLHRDLTSRAFSELWTIIWEGTADQQQQNNSNHQRISSPPQRNPHQDVQAKYERCKAIQARLLNWSDRLPLELIPDSESLPSTLDLQYAAPRYFYPSPYEPISFFLFLFFSSSDLFLSFFLSILITHH